MKTRVAIVAALITVLTSACQNKVWIDCTTSTVTRTKNKALNWQTPPSTTIYYGEARSC
jgi:hypothetical protein